MSDEALTEGEQYLRRAGRYKTEYHVRKHLQRRRQWLASLGYCINNLSHGDATHGVLCEACRIQHRKSSKGKRTMGLKAEGIWECTVLGGKSGETDQGSPNVQITVVIDDGPSKGVRCTYEDQVNAKSALYISRSCRNVGWKGNDLRTLESDVAAWIAATGGKSTVEIKHIELKRGKQYDRWVEGGCRGPAPVWDKANSIGRGGAQQLKPMSDERLADANEAMRAAMAAESGADEQVDEADIPF